VPVLSTAALARALAADSTAGAGAAAGEGVEASWVAAQATLRSCLSAAHALLVRLMQAAAVPLGTQRELAGRLWTIPKQQQRQAPASSSTTSGALQQLATLQAVLRCVSTAAAGWSAMEQCAATGRVGGRDGAALLQGAPWLVSHTVGSLVLAVESAAAE
jgi:hypothetical protein